MKKTSLLVASIISFVIYQLLFLTNSNSEENNIKYYSDDNGILSLMYHRFNENEYPSTNIRMNVFIDQIQMIKDQNFTKGGSWWSELDCVTINARENHVKSSPTVGFRLVMIK